MADSETDGERCASTVKCPRDESGEPLLQSPAATVQVVAAQHAAGDGPSATMVVPPDGGWGWVVVAASFVCNFIVDGIIFCFGIFRPEISKTLDASEAEAALVGSLLSGFYLMAGPFVSALANRYGFRMVTILGAFVAAAGFALSSLASSIMYLYFSYGVLGGIGFGMIYAPSIITVGFYFERWRALATGIAVCGSGIGTFLMAPLSKLTIEHMGWQGALLVQAGIILICGLCGALFRPLRPVKITMDKEESPPDNLLYKIKLARDEELRKAMSDNCLNDSQTTIKANNNVRYPTAAEMFNLNKTQTDDNSKLSKSTQSLNLSNIILGHNALTEKRLSVPSFPDKASHVEKDTGGVRRKSKGSLSSRRGTLTECAVKNRRGTITQLEDSTNRPMYRDDIFFSASLHRLPQYNSQKDLMGYTLSVTRLPTKRDLEEEDECHCCPEAVRRTIATMLDLSLLQSPSFILFCVSGFLTLMGFFSPFMFLAERAERGGWDKEATVWLLSAIGITNTIGRVLCGLLSSLPGVDALLVNNIALSVGGLATILSGLSFSYGFQYSYCVLFGLAIACFASLRSVLIVDLLGLEKLTNAFGILLLFQGFAAAVGAPLAAFIQEETNSRDAPFYMAGALLFVSGVLCFPLNALNRWEKQKAKAQVV